MSRPGVRTEVFLREDIQNMLRSIDQANRELAIHLPVREVLIYRAGFAAAVQAMATAFDVTLHLMDTREERRLILNLPLLTGDSDG